MRNVRETVIVGGRTFRIDRPPAADWVDGAVPYWSEIWPAARMLAKVVLAENWQPGTPCLDLGCGLGLAGIAALARGLVVTFADRVDTAIRFAAANARLNGFDRFETAVIDFATPPAARSFPVLIGSDLLYSPTLVEPLVGFIHTVLAPGGVCLIADPDRKSARPFATLAGRAGMTVGTQFIRTGEPGGERHKGTIFRIGKSERRPTGRREPSGKD